MNKVLQGDCLDILASFEGDSVDLVYLDPPFFTQKKQTLSSRNLETYEFDDSWEDIASYIEFLRQRLRQIKRVMKDHACIFFHCDKNASHHIRLLLDEVFGADRFLSEIIWTYRRWSNSSRSLLPSHQTIYMYSKTQNYLFNRLIQPYSKTTNLDQILQKRVRNKHGKVVYAEDSEGELVLNGPKQGVPLSDTWNIPYLNPKAKERIGYPTQKPILLLEQIIKLGSNEGHVILDPFCGSGTTLVASQMLKRQYIGIDISEEAVNLAEHRLKTPIKSESHLLQKGVDAYDNLPDYVQKILAGLPVKLVQRNSGIDAIHNQFKQDRPIVIRVQRHGEDLVTAINKLKHAGASKNAIEFILIRTKQDTHQLSLFDMNVTQDVIIIDSLNLILSDQLKKLEETI